MDTKHARQSIWIVQKNMQMNKTSENRFQTHK